MKLHDRKPDIENLYKVLRRMEPGRPTLFEFFMNHPLYERLAGRKLTHTGNPGLDWLHLLVDAFAAAGYDFSLATGCDMYFETGKKHKESTISLNDGFVITDWKSFEEYKWPVPEDYDYSRLSDIKAFMPEGMKLMVCGPLGVLENTVALMGYENLCLMLYEEPDLVKAVTGKIGDILYRYYEISLSYDTVGILMVADDWGFKSSTLISPEHLREYIFPWHKKLVDLAHSHGIPAILHSCGYLEDIMDDVINLGYDGKHSFEDTIKPVEESYERWHDRIAILGGIDMNFMVNGTEEEITARSANMLKRTAGRGGYALGTGNSVPEYIPFENFHAMLKAALND